jgi:CTP synthase
MSLVLVTHEIDEPALYGAAAVIAARRGGRLLYPEFRFDTGLHADAVQHVLAGGGLGPSGLYWSDRLTRSPALAASSVDEIVTAARESEIILPVHPDYLPNPTLPGTILRGAQNAGVETTVLAVRTSGESFVCEGDRFAGRDRFGRIMDRLESASGNRIPLEIGLVAAERDQRGVYPATLASLADAADSLSINLTIRYIDPVALGKAGGFAIAASLAGMVLPGGSAMKNVPGQIEAAAAGLAAGVPTVGLCLGMQTMATAIAWRRFGRGTANLAEADPGAPIKTFVPMAAEKGMDGRSLPEHRTGTQLSAVKAQTRLAEILPVSTSVHYNHRYRLDPALVNDLEEAGLRVAATGLDGAIVDAIEDRDHPFFIGMQGHPELGSRENAPHPLLSAFLSAALEYTHSH